MPKLLFVTKLPFYPDSSGGAELSTLYLLDSLVKRGWQVEAICGAAMHSHSVISAYWHSLTHFRLPFQIPFWSVVKDVSFGYAFWRCIYRFSKRQDWWIEWLEQRLHDYQPDVVIGMINPKCSLLNHAAQQGYPTFFFARITHSIEEGFIMPDNIRIIANSPYVASALANKSRNEIGVVLPFVEPNIYQVSSRQGRYVTFINLVPQKGVNVAIEIARKLPAEKFLFVKGKWVGRSDSNTKAFLESLNTLPNVEVWDYQQDMRKVYAKTSILLVPSQFEETFGRVIIEAQCNGIPVVASSVGGIPYTLGQGGILVEPKDNVIGYVEALQKLRTQPNFYKKLSELAILNSQRPEFDAQTQVQNFIHFVKNCDLASKSETRSKIKNQ